MNKNSINKYIFITPAVYLLFVAAGILFNIGKDLRLWELVSWPVGFVGYVLYKILKSNLILEKYTVIGVTTVIYGGTGLILDKLIKKNFSLFVKFLISLLSIFGLVAFSWITFGISYKLF